MPLALPPTDTVRLARTAGVLYVAVILLGIGSELGLRAPLLTPGDPTATWAATTAGLGRLRLAILADTAMILADVGLAILFFALLRHAGERIALTAMVLRLIQAALIGASLLALIGAADLAVGGRAEAAPTILTLFEVHGIGYDLGLVFFGVNTGLTALLLSRAGLGPRWLPALLWAAAAVYLAGSLTRLGWPGVNALIQPAYAVPVIAETALAVVLLTGLARQDRQLSA